MKCIQTLLGSLSSRPLPILVLALLTPVSQAAPHDAIDDLLTLEIEDLLELSLPSMTSVLGGHVHNKGELMPMAH
jgi:hypothetical protein